MKHFKKILCLSFLFVLILTGCSKNKNNEYKAIMVGTDGMSPTITKNQIIYYKTVNKYANEDIVLIDNSNQQYVKKVDVSCLVKRIIAKENQKITFYLVKEQEEVVKLDSNNNEIKKIYYYDIIVKDKNNIEINLNKSYLIEEMKISKTDYSNLISYGGYDIFKTIFENVVNEDLPLSNRSFTLTLNDNEYFIMGDNRNYSEDSRHFGVIKKEDIVGKVNLELK